MAKVAKVIRKIVASVDIAPLIDRGASVDTELKNLTYEDKGIKARLTEVAGSELQTGETGIRLAGNESAAVISTVEKYELDASNEKFAEVQKAVEEGKLSGIMEKTQQLAVPPADIDKAADILKKAGINAMIAQAFTVSGDGFRNRDDSLEQGLEKALTACVSKSVSFRVKYEKA